MVRFTEEKEIPDGTEAIGNDAAEINPSTLNNTTKNTKILFIGVCWRTQTTKKRKK